MDVPRATRDERRHRNVSLRVVRPGARRVEVAGEMGDWLAPRALAEREPGVFEGGFALPEGAYAYKLRVDGAWELDEGNARTRGTGVFRNNVLAVGHVADEPLLFAPAGPFLYEDDGGALVVTCGVRRGHARGAPSVLWSEASRTTFERTSMTRVAAEGEHDVFRARVPISSAHARLRFELDDGLASAEFPFERATLPGPPPGWWRRAVVYAVFVDRFRPAVDRGGWREDPGADVPAGGHLDGVLRSLDDLAELGATVLYLTPLHVAASCHRYDVVDPVRIDPALGGDEAFARLVDGCHARGLRVLVDFTVSHAGRGFLPYEDVRLRGRRSRFAPWFQWTEGGELRHYGKRTDAPLFDLDAPAVRRMALDATAAWAERGIDGLRLDAAAEVPIDLAREVRRELRARRPEAIVVGEVVAEHAWRWRASGAVDAATDFAFHRAACDLLARRTIDAPAASDALAAAEAARGGPASTALRFVSTHDHARFATQARAFGAPANAALGLVHLLTWPGVPMLLYGEELGLSASVAGLEPEGAWPDRMPMPWDPSDAERATRALVRRVLAVRRASAALRGDEVEVLHAEGAVLVYRRTGEGEVVDVALNAGSGRVEIAIDDGERPALEVLATSGEVWVRGATVTLDPGSAVIARRSARGSLRARIEENDRLADLAFAARAVGAAASPKRIDFAVTEACNLRCAHCITGAPTKTGTGRARTLAPWLLDRLRPDLALASYFGFVHGGESLVAPIFWDVLAAIRAARGGARTDVHLLTNGMLLDAPLAERLAGAGVTSLAVSLDGATAGTNDRMRVGGDFHRILRGVRDALEARRAAGFDLRVGISSVLGRDALGELDALVDLALDLGVDWLKLEEMVPVNPFAARADVRLQDPANRARVVRAVARGRERGLVVVDHTLPVSVWRCTLPDDAATRAFVEADEHANRSHIHPCRDPWERACVEPDGGVRVGDFLGPRAGSVAHASLRALWNGPRARHERMRAEAMRLCGARSPSCASRVEPA
jgi:glycosidase/MoaA/NifB/PqqE/SkfB family radical SAM enzyme